MQTKHKILSLLVIGVIAAGVFGGLNVNVSDLMTKVIATKVTKDAPVTRADVAVAIVEYVIFEDEDLSDYESCDYEDEESDEDVDEESLPEGSDSYTGCDLADEDLDDYDFASINYVVTNGFMLPDADDYFNPGDSLTRAEAARYFSIAHDYLVDTEYLEAVEVPDVCTAKTKTKKSTCMYKDVKDADWFSYDVANLVVNKISDVVAYKGKSFNPNKNLTKSQFKIWDKGFKKLFD